MSNVRITGLAKLALLLLLASCGPAENDANDALTISLPRVTTAVVRRDSGQTAAEVLLHETAAGSARPNAAPAELRTLGASRYTSLQPARCELLPEKSGDATSSRRRCEGLAGYALETSENDSRRCNLFLIT
jgi:hypothetical protein